LAWALEYSAQAQKQLRKLDKQVATRILDFMRDRVAQLDDPRSTGKALLGSVLGGYWRYRVGDYRLVCEIQDDKLCILVLEVGNRKEIYR
jgi:mRNA interferase RelE/StbE